ncbi:hypothetical protein PX554_14500 [Sphingomonas sp. H39-1-10]|uniref:hypothetical protein n=1 Tax=Sphingomonas TaxID=13687 RepID=UPI000880D497|nr:MULTISPECIES: hypothetical protein [Sphingomonas]MDF0489344.1 hypothetical protein [Sphingomonas pollutisoli]SDA29940.1 hypothetical protein SAMN03159340_02448 [Sphingomonas sp. NFR15]
MSTTWGLLVPLAAITVFPLSRVITTWVRARHGYPLDDARDGKDRLPIARETELLSAENERLIGKIGRLEERIAVLERIATDPAERTAREIEALRTTG